MNMKCLCCSCWTGTFTLPSSHPESCHVSFHLASECFFQRLASSKYYSGRQTCPRKENIRTSKMAHMVGCSARVKGLSNVHSCAQCQRQTVYSNCQNRGNARRHTAVFYFISFFWGGVQYCQNDSGYCRMVWFIFNFPRWQEGGKINDFNDSAWTITMTANAVRCFP